MRYWLHATITILLSVVTLVGSLALSVIVFIFLPVDAPPLLGRIVVIVGPAIGLFLPTVIMTRIPCVCPKCGAKAKYGFAAWGNWFMPTFAWSCGNCDWSTYRWSAYQQRRLTRRV